MVSSTPARSGLHSLRVYHRVRARHVPLPAIRLRLLGCRNRRRDRRRGSRAAQSTHHRRVRPPGQRFPHARARRRELVHLRHVGVEAGRLHDPQGGRGARRRPSLQEPSRQARAGPSARAHAGTVRRSVGRAGHAGQPGPARRRSRGRCGRARQSEGVRGDRARLRAGARRRAAPRRRRLVATGVRQLSDGGRCKRPDRAGASDVPGQRADRPARADAAAAGDPRGDGRRAARRGGGPRARSWIGSRPWSRARSTRAC